LKPHAPSAKPNVVLIDQMGILPELYGFADIAFVGGSLRPFGGHNPLEPALAGTPVIFGQHMESQRESADWLLNEGYGSVVTDATTLADAVAHELCNDARHTDRERRTAAMKAHAKGTVDRVADDILARIAACATTTIC
jgi:3-deoxy-D-manno-octulosonic-acid transferase